MSLGATAYCSGACGCTETVKPWVIWNRTELKIGFLGSAHVGSTLGRHRTGAGHVIFFSSGHPRDFQELVKEADLRIRKR